MTNWPTKKLGEIFNDILQHRIEAKYIGISGLIISSLGAFVSALSFTASDGRVTSSITGFEYHLAVISDYGFKIGLFLLILGFLLQILEKMHNTENFIVSSKIILVIACSLALYILTIRLFSSLFFL